MGGFGDPRNDARAFSTFHWLLPTPIQLCGQSPFACCLKRQRAQWGERLPSLGCGNYPAKDSEIGSDWRKQDRFTWSLGSVRYPLHSIFPWLKEKACGDGRQGGDQVRSRFQRRFNSGSDFLFWSHDIIISQPIYEQQSHRASEARGMAWEIYLFIWVRYTFNLLQDMHRHSKQTLLKHDHTGYLMYFTRGGVTDQHATP